MASTPSKLATGAVLLLALWIVTYWLTPAPANSTVRISFAEAPQSADAPAPAPPRTPSPARRDPVPPAAAIESERPAHASPVLVDVAPEEVADTSLLEPAPDPEVVPPTFQMYTTEPGDTFQRIASRFYDSSAAWRVIAKANPTVDPNRLRPGIELRIPVDQQNIQGRRADGAPDVLPPPDTEFTEYIVKRGDTLSDISKSLYGRASLWQRIVDANPGINPDRLRPGSTLRIPPPPAPN